MKVPRPSSSVDSDSSDHSRRIDPRFPSSSEEEKDQPPVETTEYDRAALKLWKVVTMVGFMKEKAALMKEKLKHSYYEEYFQKDMPGVMDQSTEMFKARFSLILNEVSRLYLGDRRR